MSSHTSIPRSDVPLTVTAIAMIVLPLVALAIKLTWVGWMVFFLLFASPLLVIGYVMQVIIAATGFLGRRAAFRTSAGRARAVTAAWLTSGAAVVTAFFFVDGGDMSWGSAFMYVVGGESDSALGSLSSAVALVSAIVWIGGWCWLLAEWIVALAARRRSASSSTSAPASA